MAEVTERQIEAANLLEQMDRVHRAAAKSKTRKWEKQRNPTDWTTSNIDVVVLHMLSGAGKCLCSECFAGNPYTGPDLHTVITGLRDEHLQGLDRLRAEIRKVAQGQQPDPLGLHGGAVYVDRGRKKASTRLAYDIAEPAAKANAMRRSVRDLRKAKEIEIAKAEAEGGPMSLESQENFNDVVRIKWLHMYDEFHTLPVLQARNQERVGKRRSR